MPRVAACLHGYLRTGWSMELIAMDLRRAGYKEVLTPTFGYHLGTLEQHRLRVVRSLRALMERHPGALLDVVTFSFGGVMIRAALTHEEAPPVRRVVMLAPPNQGAELAARVREAVPIHRVGWDPMAPLLPGAPSGWPPPPAELGVLAGGTGDRGFNPWLGADNDGKVRVDEARIEGARDFLVIPLRHPFFPVSPTVRRQVRAFLDEGQFAR